MTSEKRPIPLASCPSSPMLKVANGLPPMPSVSARLIAASWQLPFSGHLLSALSALAIAWVFMACCRPVSLASRAAMCSAAARHALASGHLPSALSVLATPCASMVCRSLSSHASRSANCSAAVRNALASGHLLSALSVVATC